MAKTRTPHDLLYTSASILDTQPSIIGFLQQNGGRIQRTAVLGPRPLMALAQMISRLARYGGVAFFTDRAEADRWCAA